MKINRKKLVSVVLICGLATSQMACASKVTKISAPLDQVKFDKDYKYDVKFKTNYQISEISGDQIVTAPGQLTIKTKENEKLVMSKEILQIDGTSNQRVGSQAGKGFLIGLGSGALGGVVISVINSHRCCTTDPDVYLYILLPPLLGLIGGGLGAIIGAFIPRHQKIQITPVISPTTSGVDAGVNVGVTF